VGLVPTFYFGFKAMQHGSITERIDKIAAAAAKKNGVEFVRSEIVGSRRNSVVRIFIDKPAGVTLDDCSEVSRLVEEAMDAEDLMPSSYVLEVSSPGLERALVDIGDFERYSGKKAKLKTSEPINGQANFSGRIISVEASEIVFEDKTHGTVRIPFDKVAKANLKVDLAEEFKKKR
jgi:ribosome maturation factor RimP